MDNHKHDTQEEREELMDRMEGWREQLSSVEAEVAALETELRAAAAVSPSGCMAFIVGEQLKRETHSVVKLRGLIQQGERYLVEPVEQVPA
jgi:hypothetical protein